MRQGASASAILWSLGRAGGLKRLPDRPQGGRAVVQYYVHIYRGHRRGHVPHTEHYDTLPGLLLGK